NFIPDCNLKNRAANGECGAIDNSAFGTIGVTTHYADDVLRGFGVREANWQTSASVQHELMSGVALNVGYFRTSYINFLVTDNLAVTPADYDRYCITAPVDARLPGGGGNQLCGLYDINPRKFGEFDALVTRASRFGHQSEIFNGVEATIHARLGKGRLLQGGV